MRYMLDTCALIDALTEPDSLGKDVCALLEDYNNLFYVSQETVKEVILKYKSKNIWSHLWTDAEQIVDTAFGGRFIIEQVDQGHLRQYARLQWNLAQGHKDPSDHLIISQAIVDRMPLISRDRKFEFYRSQGLDLIYYGR